MAAGVCGLLGFWAVGVALEFLSRFNPLVEDRFLGKALFLSLPTPEEQALVFPRFVVQHAAGVLQQNV